MNATKEQLSTPAKLSSQQKIALTDDAARKIIAAEATARDKKTEKLRALRLQKLAGEAEAAAPEPPKIKKKKK
jgi:hypothetical protein